MEPRPEGRGDAARIEQAALDVLASMEPRPEGRGDVISNMHEEGALPMLQWSRGPKAAETMAGKDLKKAERVLQWSRGPKAAETPVRPEWCAGACDGFNGAAARRPRRPGGPARTLRGDRPASMEPRPEGRGDAAIEPDVGFRLDASMEPRPEGRGDLGLPGAVRGVPLASMEPRPEGRGDGSRKVIRGAFIASFNGAAARRPRRLAEFGVRDLVDYVLQWSRGPKAAETSPGIS